MSELMILNYKLLSLCIFQNILKDPALSNLVSCFAYMEKSLSEALAHYSKFLKIIYESEFEGDFSLYLRDLIIHDKNLFTIACASNKEPNDNIKNAAINELKILSELMNVTDEKIKSVMVSKFEGSEQIVQNLGAFSNSRNEITYEQVKNYCSSNCYGIFAKHSAFSYDKTKTLIPVKNPDNICLNDIKDYDIQKKKLCENTFALIKGKSANNVLLYGDRGCGKSSSVKAVFNEFKKDGLKIVQILKNDLSVLNYLLEELSKIPSKFIIFIDDLSFCQEDENLSVIKSVLEGALSVQAQNTVIYATTNRRHIIKETFSSREGNEVHLADTIDENASLSDRFGITLTYLAPNKDKYIEIARKIAQDKNAAIADDFEREAEKFALYKSSRSPRVAQQFVKQYLSNK